VKRDGGFSEKTPELHTTAAHSTVDLTKAAQKCPEQHGAANTAYRCTPEPRPAQQSIAQHSSPRHSTAQHSTAYLNTAQDRTIHHRKAVPNFKPQHSCPELSQGPSSAGR
jgi:hypothetical protein